MIALLGRWHGAAARPRASAGSGAAALRAAGLRRPPKPPAAELRPSRSRHSKRRDAEAVRHHYDVSNEFFALFLDETMTYSCALLEEGAETLEDAQRAKLDLICRKLELEPGQRMLDIGCGWGSLGIHAASEHGASVLGITLSPPRPSSPNERAREAGVGDLCEFRVADYRDLADDDFDAVASIGMVEHVGGSQADEYGRQVARVLRPGGRVLNHGIAWVPATEQGFHIGGDFSNRYVFPDGEVQNLSRMLLSLERAGLETLHVENLHNDYAETLRHWATRLDQNLEEAERLAGRGAGAGLAPLPARRAQRLRDRADRRLPDALLASADRAASGRPPAAATARRAGGSPPDPGARVIRIRGRRRIGRAMASPSAFACRRRSA